MRMLVGNLKLIRNPRTDPFLDSRNSIAKCLETCINISPCPFDACSGLDDS